MKITLWRFCSLQAGSSELAMHWSLVSVAFSRVDELASRMCVYFALAIFEACCSGIQTVLENWEFPLRQSCHPQRSTTLVVFSDPKSGISSRLNVTRGGLARAAVTSVLECRGFFAGVACSVPIVPLACASCGGFRLGRIRSNIFRVARLPRLCRRAGVSTLLSVTLTAISRVESIVVLGCPCSLPSSPFSLAKVLAYPVHLLEDHA